MTKQNTYTIWSKALRFAGIVLALGLFAGLTSNVALAQQAPPVDTRIGNQASASYTDSGGNTRTVTSNTVETVVQQVPGVTVSAGLSKTVSPGGQVSFTHTITNTGNGADQFQLSADYNNGLTNDDFDYTSVSIYPDADGNGTPDNFTAITITPNVDEGDNYGIVIVANVPASAVDAEASDIELTATSTFSSSTSDDATNTATVEEDAVIDFVKSGNKSTAEIGETVTYTITYSNNGNALGEDIIIYDPLPSGVTYVAGTGSWSGSGTSLGDNVGGGDDPSGISYWEDNGVVVAVIDQLSANASGTLSFNVTVDSGTEGTSITNTAEYSFNDAYYATNPFAQNSDYQSAKFTDTNPFTVTVEETYGINLNGTADTVKVASADQGETVTWLNEYKNTGTTTDRYNIEITDVAAFPSGTTFTLYKATYDGSEWVASSPFTDTNSDGIPDTGPISPNGVIRVILQASLPSTGSGGPFKVKKTLTSIGDPGESANHVDQLTEILAVTVDLTNDAASGDTGALGEGDGPESSAVKTLSADPGSTVNFTLYVKNTSSIDDNYDLAYSSSVSGSNLGSPGSLPSGWAVSFLDPNNGNSVITQTGTLSGGSSKEVTARVTIPAGEDPGAVSIYIRTLSQATGAKDIIHDQVSVNVYRNVSLTTNQNGQIYPGGSKTYQHTLTVNSNVPENDPGYSTPSDFQLNLGNTDATRFSATVYYDVNGDGSVDGGDELITTAASGSVDLTDNTTIGALSYGTQLKFIVKVTANSGAQDGATNTTTVTLSDDEGVLSDKSNQDITTVVAGLLTVDKFQALDNGSGSPQTYAKTDKDILPGEVVHYKITVTNNGAATVTGVTVSDDVPFYTTQNTAVAVSGDGSPAISNEPGVGSTGTVEVTSASLAPGESFDITFSVIVNN